MYCEPCRVERLGTARFCVICGTRLLARAREEVEADLARVRWLIAEFREWDASMVNGRARGYLVERYRQREKVLLAALNVEFPPIIPVEVEPEPGPETFAAPAVEEVEIPVGLPTPPIPAVLLDAEPPAPTVEDRVVAEASSWSRIWKPFLNESIGWFIGAFLILSGTFFLVSDAWSDMQSTTRALVVFGLAAGWTLGFSAWAQFLWRRETTRGASRVLKLIGAAMAPLAPFAVGPVAAQFPLLAALLVLVWAVIAAALVRGVTADMQKVGLRCVPLAMAACATIMGLAPLVAGFHGAALWLMAIPVGLLWLNARSGVQGTDAKLFAYLAPLYLAVIFGARLHYALLADGLNWGTWAPFFALALTAALELRDPDAKSPVVPILVVGGQLGLMAWGLLGAPPAFFLTALVGAHTTFRVLKSSQAPRWIYALYFFSYFAFQTCGQLVPGILKQLLADLKASLGYAPAGVLPFAYNAIYAALFVIAGAVLAVRWLKTRPTWAEPILRCTWVTSALMVALAVSSLPGDTRPAMLSLPLLLVLNLGLGLWLDRGSFTRVAAATAVCFAATLVVGAGADSAALRVAFVALGLAVLSIPFTAPHREPLSLAGYGLVAATVALAWVMPGDAGQPVALVLAFCAAWLIGRNLDLSIAMESAWLIPAVAVARGFVLWAPEFTGIAIAGAAVGLALLARSKNRLRYAEPASALAALVAPGWQLVLQTEGKPVLLGATLLASAAALALGARRTGPSPTAGWRDCVAILFGTTSLLAGPKELQLWPGWDQTSSAAAYAVLGLAASVWAATRGRRWRPALLASLTTFFSLVVWIFAFDSHGPSTVIAAIAAVGVLLTIRALAPSVAVPIASAFALSAAFLHQDVLILIAGGLSLLALFEEWDFTWRNILGRRRIAWAASLSSLAVLGVMFSLALWSDHKTASLQGLWIFAVVLPLVWVRATRSSVLAFALAPIAILALFRRDPNDAWLVTGALFAFTQLVCRLKAVRILMFGRKDADRLELTFGPWLLAGAAAAGGFWISDGGSGLPWALLMLLAASELLPLRLAVAALFIVATPALAPTAVMVLLAIGFVDRLAPKIISVALGSRLSAYNVTAAAISAVGLAGFHAATGGSTLLLGATLAAAAILLGQRWLFAAAVVAAALPIAQPAWIPVGAAALAALLRFSVVKDAVHKAFGFLRSPVPGDTSSAVWLGALVSVVIATYVGQRDTALLMAGGLLLLSPLTWEVAAASVLSVALVYLIVPMPLGAALLGGAGFALCLLGSLLEDRKAWHHAGWILSVVALAGGNDLHRPETAIAWGFAAACAVVVARRNPAFEWVRWLGLAAGAHVGLFYAGLALATGAPRELILPWVATSSFALAAAGIWMAKRTGRSAQRFASSFALLGLGIVELAAGLVLLEVPHAREAAVALFGIVLALWALAGRIYEDDDRVSAVFFGLLIPVAFVTLRRLGFGAGPDTVETLAALVAGAGVGALARQLKPKTSSVATSFAFWWPLMGLAAAPWETPWTLCLLLLAQSAHFAVVARTGAMRRRASLLSTVAFNGAMATAFVASNAHSAEYLLIPFGLSLLVLLKVFESDLGEGTRVKLRTAAVTIVYGAAAFRPLTFDSTGALWLCVGLCVLGVALGVLLRVRSYVYLGTAFLVTSIAANLIRYGVREPRIGALFLSGLGLAVVGFMVLVTTRRSELVGRYQQARSMLQGWEG